MIPTRIVDPDSASRLEKATVIVRAAREMIRAEFHREGGPRALGPDKMPIHMDVEAFL